MSSRALNGHPVAIQAPRATRAASIQSPIYRCLCRKHPHNLDDVLDALEQALASEGGGGELGYSAAELDSLLFSPFFQGCVRRGDFAQQIR
eukprot:3090479-Rhodomonas_salina.1